MIEIKAKELKSLKEKSQGLLGAKKPYSIYFKTRWGIHTFFMKFSIDVLILNKKNRVVSFRENLMPYRIFMWNPFFDKIVELPAGTINRLNIKKGESVKLSFY